LYFSSFLSFLVDIFEKLKNLVGGLGRGRMAMSQISPEIYWKLWVKTSWNILEKNPPWGVRTLYQVNSYSFIYFAQHP
jgi:hypothetical protein